jgi:hypothetical protein
MNTKLLIKEIENCIASEDDIFNCRETLAKQVENILRRYQQYSPYYFIDGYWKSDPSVKFTDYCVSIEGEKDFENDDEIFFYFDGKDKLVQAYQDGEKAGEDFVVTDYRRADEEDISEDLSIYRKADFDAMALRSIGRASTLQEWDKFTDSLYDAVTPWTHSVYVSATMHFFNHVSEVSE